jgi:hypothetical protein
LWRRAAGSRATTGRQRCTACCTSGAGSWGTSTSSWALRGCGWGGCGSRGAAARARQCLGADPAAPPRGIDPAARVGIPRGAQLLDGAGLLVRLCHGVSHLRAWACKACSRAAKECSAAAAARPACRRAHTEAWGTGRLHAQTARQLPAQIIPQLVTRRLAGSSQPYRWGPMPMLPTPGHVPAGPSAAACSACHAPLPPPLWSPLLSLLLPPPPPLLLPARPIACSSSRPTAARAALPALLRACKSCRRRSSCRHVSWKFCGRGGAEAGGGAAPVVSCGIRCSSARCARARASTPRPNTSEANSTTRHPEWPLRRPVPHR